MANIGSTLSKYTSASELSNLLESDKFGIVSVKTYGAVGDGVTDDTEAIQDAIDTMHAVGGGVIYLPKGTYLTSTSLLLYTNISLIGAGRQVSVIYNTNVAGEAAIKKSGTSRIQTVSIENLQVRGNALSGIGIDFNEIAYSTIINVLSYDHGSHGIRVYGDDAPNGAYYNRFYNVESTDNTGDGLRVEDHGNDLFVFGGRYSDNGGKGINLVTTTYELNNVKVFGASCEGNTSYGINVDAKSCGIHGSRIENNESGAIGIKVTANGLRAVLLDNFYASQSTPISSAIADAGTTSPTIIEPLSTNGSVLNIINSIHMVNDCAITGLKSLSTTSTKGKNLLIKNVSVTEAVTNQTFTLPTAEPDSNYEIVAVFPNWTTTVAEGSKSTTQYQVYFGTAAPANATINVLIMR